MADIRSKVDLFKEHLAQESLSAPVSFRRSKATLCEKSGHGMLCS